MNEACIMDTPSGRERIESLRPTTSTRAQQIIGALYLLAIAAAAVCILFCAL